MENILTMENYVTVLFQYLDKVLWWSYILSNFRLEKFQKLILNFPPL